MCDSNTARHLNIVQPMRLFQRFIKGSTLVPVLMVLAVYAVLFCVFFWEGLRQGVAANYDTIYQFLPYRMFGAYALHAYQQLPFWDPAQMLGVPLLADIQSGALSPFNLLFMLGNAGVMFNIMMGLHYALAGVGVWLFLRAWRVRTMPALVAGAVYMLSGPMISQKEIVTVVFAAMYLPWLFWALERLCQTRQWRYVVALSLIVWLQIIDGHVEVCVYSGVYAAAYTLWRLWALHRHRLACMALVCGGVGCGFALAAPQLLLSASMVAQSLRSSFDLGFARSGQFTPSELLGFIYPYIEGHGWGAPVYAFARLTEHVNLYRTIALYMGSSPLLLGVIAPVLCRGAARRLVVFFWVSALLQLAFSLGEYTPVHLLAFHVPLLGSFRHADRGTCQIAFAVAVAAGMTLHQLTLREGWARQVIACVTSLLLVAVVIFLTAHAEQWNQLLIFPEWTTHIRLTLPNVYIPLIFMVATVALLALAIWRPFRVWLPLCVLLLWGVDMRAVARQFVPASELSYAALTQAVALRPPKGTTRGRVISYSQTSMRVPAAGMSVNTFQVVSQNPFVAQYATFPLLDWNVFAGVRDAGIINSPRFFHAARFFSHADVRYADYRDDYFCTPTSLVTGNHGFEATQCLGRVFLTTSALVFPNLASIAEAMCATNIAWPTPATIAVVVDDPALASWPEELSPDATGSCAITDYTPNKVTVRVATSAPMLLVLGDFWYSDWRATLDGTRVPIARADGMLRAVLVPEGTHTVVFFYHSTAFVYGGGIALVALSLLVAVPRLRQRMTSAGTSTRATAGSRCWQTLARWLEAFACYTGVLLACIAFTVGIPEQGLRVYTTARRTDLPSYTFAVSTNAVMEVRPEQAHALAAAFYSNCVYGMTITAWRKETNAAPALLFDCMNAQWDFATAELYKHVTTRPRTYRNAFVVDTNQVRSCVRLLCMETNGTICVQNATVIPIGPGTSLAINIAKNLTVFYTIWLVLVTAGLFYLVVTRHRPLAMPVKIMLK